MGPYVHAERHNGLLFLSGLTALGSPAQGRSLAEQMEAICSCIAKIARSERTDSSSLVKITLFVSNSQLIRELRAVWSEYFAGCAAGSLVQIGKLFSPDILVEAEAVLALP
jgi:2-iminobutanoate/2-iminopropanoate deaminase